MRGEYFEPEYLLLCGDGGEEDRSPRRRGTQASFCDASITATPLALSRAPL